MLKKMGHVGQEVLDELSKLKKRLKHTTELVWPATCPFPTPTHAFAPTSAPFVSAKDVNFLARQREESVFMIGSLRRSPLPS
jgi:hypothetical protein